MMKKLLIFMLVLGMASTAGAVYENYVDLQISSLDGVPIAPTDYIVIGDSQWVNMDIVYYAPLNDGMNPPMWTLGSLGLDIIAAGSGTLDLSELTWPAGHWDTMMTQIIEVIPGKRYTISTGMNNGTPGGGMEVPVISLDHILFHCDAADDTDVLVYLVENPGAPSGATLDIDMYSGDMGFVGKGPGVVIHQVPEPMTVLLLGFGGLLLRRRR